MVERISLPLIRKQFVEYLQIDRQRNCQEDKFDYNIMSDRLDSSIVYKLALCYDMNIDDVAKSIFFGSWLFDKELTSCNIEILESRWEEEEPLNTIAVLSYFLLPRAIRVLKNNQIDRNQDMNRIYTPSRRTSIISDLVNYIQNEPNDDIVKFELIKRIGISLSVLARLQKYAIYTYSERVLREHEVCAYLLKPIPKELIRMIESPGYRRFMNMDFESE